MTSQNPTGGAGQASSVHASQDPVVGLPGLLEEEEVVASAARGASNPGFERDRATSYPARLALRAAAWRPELLAAMERAGVAGARVLDVGCGPGVAVPLLLEAGARAVVGCDFDPVMVDLGRALPGMAGADLRVLDATQVLPFEAGELDLVWMSDFWSPAALPQLRRVLRPGGRLVQSTTASWGQSYAFDLGLELRVAQAAHLGLTRWRARSSTTGPSSGAGTPDRDPAQRGGWARGEAWTSVVERRHPVPTVYAQYRRQDFGLFTGGFVADHVEAQDWQTLARLWDPQARAGLFERSDTHLVSGIHHQVWTALC